MNTAGLTRSLSFLKVQTPTRPQSWRADARVPYACAQPRQTLPPPAGLLQPSHQPSKCPPSRQTLGQSEAGVARTSLLLQTPASPRPHVRHRPVGGPDCHLRAPSRRLIGSPGSSAPVSSRRPPPRRAHSSGRNRARRRSAASLCWWPALPPPLPPLPVPSPLLRPARLPPARAVVRCALCRCAPSSAGRARPCSALAAPARSVPPSPGARGGG